MRVVTLNPNHRMRILLLACVLLCRVSRPLSAQEPEQMPLLDFEAILPSVVTLVTYAIDGEVIGQGSGFVLLDKRIATNRHVIEGARRVEVRSSKGELLGSFTFAEAVSPTADIAILPALSQLPEGLALTTDPPRVGEPVYAIGSPLGLPNTLSNGIISAIRNDLASPMLQITAPISPGSSGGPVINMRGEVLGVATASIRAGQNLNFAVPSRIVQALANRPSTRRDFPPLPPPDDMLAAEDPGSDRTSGAAMSALLPSTGLGWIDEKDFRLFLMGCFADVRRSATICAVDLEVKRANGFRYSLAISSPMLTSPDGGEVTAQGLWIATETYLPFTPRAEIQSTGGRGRTYLVFKTIWQAAGRYQLALSLEDGDADMRKFFKDQKARRYTFAPQPIRFIDASADQVTRTLLGLTSR
jgi:hypothetical protein